MPYSSGRPADQPAAPGMPDIALTAVRTGRTISAAACRGHMLLLLFHNHRTLAAVEEVQHAVRGRYPISTGVLSSEPIAKPATVVGFLC